jgi:hypothetical protein
MAIKIILTYFGGCQMETKRDENEVVSRDFLLF